MPDIEIAVTNAPDIPGLCFRHFRGESDYQPMLDVLLSSESADQIERTDSIEALVENYQKLVNCDPFQDMIFVEADGELIGFARGWWSDEAIGGQSYPIVGFLVPAWRRRGIGSAMLQWMENHLREGAPAHPTGRERFFQTEAKQYQEGKRILLERAGYQPVRFFYDMIRPTMEDIPDLSLPEGLELRPALPEHYRAIWASVNESSVDEWGYSPPSEDDYHAWLSHPHFQPDLWQVAWDTAREIVAGHVLTFIEYDQNEKFNRKRGYTEGIGVVPAWRRRGVARALIARSLQAQRAAGMSESALAVDSENSSGATRLYESCGFQVVSKNAVYRKPLFP